MQRLLSVDDNKPPRSSFTIIKPVTHYIRHRPPMLLVDEIASADLEYAATRTTIKTDNLFFDASKGGVPAWAGVEIMAQTAGVWVGMEDERQGVPPELGFLLGSRSYDAFQPIFHEGETLHTTVKAVFINLPMVVFEGEMKNSAGICIAKGEFTAFRPDDVEAYLLGKER